MEKYINKNSVYVKCGTQENMILDYIKKHGSITNLEAILNLGVMQCPARIWGLKRRGIKIATRKKQVFDRFQQPKTIVEYFIKNEEGEVI